MTLIALVSELAKDIHVIAEILPISDPAALSRRLVNTGARKRITRLLFCDSTGTIDLAMRVIEVIIDVSSTMLISQ